MSFLLQRQFFALQVQNPELKSNIEILNGIKDLFLDWNFSFSANETMLESITSEFSSGRYLNVQYFVQIGIDTNKNSFRFDLFILNNGIPVRIESKSHRITLFRYFLQINRNLCLGKFSVCPKSGVLKFGGQFLAAEEMLGQLNTPKSDQRLVLLKLIQKVRRISQGIELYLIRIFRMVNYRASFHQNSDSSEVHFDRSYFAQIQELEKVLPYTHQELKYLTKSGWRLKHHESFTPVPSLLRITQIFQSKSMSCLENKIDSISPQQLHEWTELQCIHDRKTKNSEKVEKSQLLFDRFSIRKVRNLSITETSTVDLFIGSKCARPNDFQKPKIQVQFVKKSPLSQKGEKSISRQSNFVDLYMWENGKEGLAEYLQVRVFSKESYFDEQSLPKVQPLDEKSLFLSFYPNDVCKYTERRTNFMSLSSKLLLLLKIDKALSGMSKTKSQHMDLKPQNIMIDGSQNVRLIDFGQSVHPKLGLSSKPGVSIPYSAPEFFSRYKFSPERCDIYSLGTMIFELVFNEVPQVLASNREKIVPWYQSAERYGLMFRFQPQKLCYGAEQRIGRLMGLLSMKCLNFSWELRPLEGWIRIYLKKLIQLSYHY